MNNQSPWSLKVWDTAAKASLKATVTRLTNIAISKGTNAPYTFTFTATLSDYQVTNLDRGMYFELTRARSGTPTLWENGYLQTILKNTSNPMSYMMSCVSPMWFLSEFRTLLNYNAGPGTNYADVLDLFNGVGSPLTDPEHQGLLPPNWLANWVDNFYSSSPPGVGDIWHGGGDTALSDITNEASHYNFLIRETPGVLNTAYAGEIDIGPLGDPSGSPPLTIWGGQPLLDDMVANHGYTSENNRADMANAAAFGYAVITNAQHQSDYQNIRNIVWILGKNGHSIHNLAGGPPLDSGGSLQNGWAAFSSSHAGPGRPYWTKSASSYATYDGHVYSFIAARGNTSDATHSPWQYGVVDITSVNTYGPCEYYLDESKIHESFLLLSAGLGCLNTWAIPVESWTFTVAHPLRSSDGNPHRAYPGQTVVVHYSGQVPSIKRDANGQWIASGSGIFTYAEYPGSGLTSYQLNEVKRITQYEESWSNGQFVQTLTLGTSKTRKNQGVNSTLAKQLLRNRPHRQRTHSFKKYTFDGIPFLCSKTPLAWDREKLHQLILNPGAIAVSDVAHSQFFTDGHKVTFSVLCADGQEYLDFWINKPVDNDTLLSPNPAGRAYLAFRLAFTVSANSGTNSGTNSGFYSTTDGSTWTQRGTVHRSLAFDSSRRVTQGVWYRVTITWHGGKFEAYLMHDDTRFPAGIQQEQHVATFNDKSTSIAFGNWGAIGFMLHGGSAVATLIDLHAQPHHPHTPPSQSATLPVFHGGVLYTKPVHLSGPQQGRYSSLGTPKEIGI